VLDPKLPGVRVRAQARVEAKTGGEMEALTACAVALLAVYDMVKAADPAMEIGELRLVEKSGGLTGEWHASPDPR
jgi:cyclic pyranopterin phosphate synthase